MKFLSSVKKLMTCVSSICMYELRYTHIGTHFFCRQAAAVIFL